ncbi:MAG: methyltransferase domain-containing protein [Endomicrobiaceae bacterium]|nr:methyltransferase domain-containing protein [Endomicrobiaceae bacterium]
MSGCIICDHKYLTKIKAYFVPFLVERMFDGQNFSTDLVHCKCCGVYYSSYRPTLEQMEKLYIGYRNDVYQQQRFKFEKEYTEEFNYFLGHNINELNMRKHNLFDIFKNNIDISKIRSVLDFGGDRGQFIPDQLTNINKYVYEISDVNTVNGVKKISKEAELLKYKYDLIMCCHVLEHVSYPMEIINKLINLMKKGNYLYIEVPYEDYWLPKTIKIWIKEQIKKQLIFLGLNYPLQPIPIHEHMNMFRKQTFKKIFKSKKFNIIYLQLNEDKNISGVKKTIRCLVQKLF